MRVKVFFVRDDAGREARMAAMGGAGLMFCQYEGVAVVEVECLEAAFEATQNFDDASWPSQPNTEMLTVPVRGVRSSCVGDMFETPDGLFVVQPCGFARHEEVCR